MQRQEISKTWYEPFGDRRQELALIGVNMDEGMLRTAFDHCLLTDAELQVGPDGWALFPDQFASWHNGPPATA